MSEQLRLRIDNRLPELDRLREEVEGFLARSGVSGRESFHIQLALDELVTNVINYAYEAQGGHAIDLTLEHAPGHVDMVLEDAGRPFNPLLSPEPDVCAAPERRKVGGLGIHFVRRTMDELRYERLGGRNILHIRKKTKQEP